MWAVIDQGKLLRSVGKFFYQAFKKGWLFFEDP
jgi:hypothetical protein